MKRSESIIIRLERAGGALTEASGFLSGTGPDTIPLGDAIRDINQQVSDLRSAIVQIQMGMSIEDALGHMKEKK